VNDVRELKFRAWYEKEKQYVHFTGIFNERPVVSQNSEIRGTTLVTKKSYGASILEQYTGLKDKNGKEIYEGDIVRITDLTAFEMFGGDSPIMKAYTRNWTVLWGEVGFKAKYCDSDFDFTSDIIHDLAITGVEYEVIGNIHEKAGE
jgi:uncharacterized phage protein (TIGR01671 family)